MKRFLLSTVLLCSFFIGFGQCPSGDITLTSQAEVDAFAATFPNCTEFSGDLTISGNDIIDISSLPQLISVGNLIIENNTQLTSLVGLQTIENFLGETLIISNNPLLLSLSGLGGLDDFQFEMEVINNDSLVNLEGLNELISTDFLTIEGNDALLNLTGLDNYIGSAVVTFSNNASLESFDGMNNFNATTSLTIEDNPSLINISSFSGSELIEGFFIINNDSLTNIDGLEITSPLFGFRIDGNDALSDISAVSNYETPSSFIEITNNPNLSDCRIALLCNNIDNTDLITIENNAPGCDSVVEVFIDCSFCSSGDVILTSQAEVDEFGSITFGCDIIEGTLRISGVDIVDLSPLSSIQTVGGFEIIDNRLLESLDGLDLFSIGSTLPETEVNFIISDNDLLENIDGLSGVFEVFAETFEISNNPSLTTISPLNFAFITTNNVVIINNNNLTDLGGLIGVEGGLEGVIIEGNDLLQNLSGLNNLTFSNNLSIINNNSLENLLGLGSLTTVGEELLIAENDSLENLGGLMNYSNGGTFSIVNNISLTSMDGVGAFETLVLSIRDNPSMVDVISLDQVENIGEILEIVNNDNLISLDGLQNLNTIGFGFTLSGNEMLTNITALSDLLDPSMYVVITNNPNLSVCDIEVVCSFISNLEPSQDILITNNGPNCNSVEEVEEQCLLTLDEEFHENRVTLYPNPTENVFSIILTSDIQLQNIDVFSVTGKKILTTQETSIDFSSLTRGVYFARIQTNQGTVIKKIVKK